MWCGGEAPSKRGCRQDNPACFVYSVGMRSPQGAKDSCAVTFPITRAGDVCAVPTPDHTPGHQSVVLRNSTTTYFFTRYTSYPANLMLERNVDCVAPSTRVTHSTTRPIQHFVRDEPAVYLPSHDPSSWHRFTHKLTTTAPCAMHLTQSPYLASHFLGPCR